MYSHPAHPSSADGPLTLQGYLRVLREQWRVVLGVVILAVLAAGGFAMLRPPEYTARLTLFVSAQSTGPDDTAYQASQLAQQRVPSYQVLLTSRPIAKEVVERLGLNATPEDVAERITATTPPDTALIQVAVTGRSAERTAAVANTAAAVMVGLVGELDKSLVAGFRPPPVAIHVVAPASPPESPSSSGTASTILIGLLAGVALAGATALARNALDTSVRSADQLSEAAGAPTLGVLGDDRRARKDPLAIQRDRRSGQREAFQQIRTKLQFLEADRQSKVYVVTSALPREGKTTALCNLASALGAAGTKTVIVEADLRRPRLATLAGMPEAVGLTSVVAGRIPAEQAVQSWSAGWVDVLTSGPTPPNPSEWLAASDLSSLFSHLRDRYEVILVDTPPLLPVSDAATVAANTDGAILICRLKSTPTASVRAAAESLSSVSTPVLGTILTGARNVPKNEYYSRAESNRSAKMLRWRGNRSWPHFARLVRRLSSAKHEGARRAAEDVGR